MGRSGEIRGEYKGKSGVNIKENSSLKLRKRAGIGTGVYKSDITGLNLRERYGDGEGGNRGVSFFSKLEMREGFF